MNKFNEEKNMSECDTCEPPFSDSCVGCPELGENTKLSQYDGEELRSHQIGRYFEMLECISPSPRVLKL